MWKGGRSEEKLPFLLSIGKFFFFLGTVWAKEKVECLRCQLSACFFCFFFYSHTHKYSDFRSSLPSLEVIALHQRLDFQCKFYWINMKMEKCLTSPCHAQFSSVTQSCPTLWYPWSAARQAFLSIISSRSPLKLMSIESVMPSNHLILCHPLLLLPSIFLSIRVFSNESVLWIGWPKYWSFSFSISPSNEYSGLISFRMDWLDLLAVQGTLKSLLQHDSSKALLGLPWQSTIIRVSLIR